jgi:DNA invertase Pin-like site-specific DNA recombinase
MTTTDLYLRLSDLRVSDLEEDGTSESLVHKETLLRALAARLGWIVGRVVIENDLMPTGRNGKSRNASAFKRRKIRTPGGRVEWRVFRPGFRSMLADIETGRADAIIAEDLDRACRDPRDLEDLADVMRAHRANARSLSGSLQFTDGGNDSELLTARIVVAVANKSSADTARRVGQARERQALTGKWGGGPRPYGFASDGVTVVEAEAEVIRAAAAGVLAAPASHAARCDPALAEADGGVTLKAFARSLRERGMSTVTGAQWSADTLRSILMRPRNAGISIHKGAEIEVPEADRPPWMRDPILAPDTWRAVVAVLTDESRRTSPGNAPRWLGSGIYLCGICDDGTSVYVSGGREHSPTYRCKARAHLRRAAIALDDHVSAYVTERLARPDAAGLLAPAAPAVDVPALRAELARCHARLTEIAMDYDNDVITRAQRDVMTRSRRARIDVIETQLAAATVADPLAGIAGSPDAADIWDGMEDLERQRAILRRLAVVTLLPAVHKGRGFNPATIRIEPRR